MLNNTIVAQATPIGSGAIALIRLSGEDVFAIVSQIAKVHGPSLSERPSHSIAYGTVTSNEQACIDQVLFFLMHGPKTFTGEDCIEITCHNNQHIVQAIIHRCILAGARLAERGEFTRRAVENSKMELLQAEAIQDLIHAQNAQEIQRALAQLDGSFSAWINNLTQILIQAQALCEVSFEFLDEEYNPQKQLIALLNSISQQLALTEQQFSMQQQIRNGLRIVLIGSTNAGKSSLLNRICNQDRAIVTSVPGTTRDTIEVIIPKPNIAWTLVDTAGLRDTDDAIEAAGIKRTKREIAKADLLILLIDGTVQRIPDDLQAEYRTIQQQHGHKLLIIQTKADLTTKENPFIQPDLYISNTQATGFDELTKLIEAKSTQLLPSTELPFSLNQRHMHSITRVQKTLSTIITEAQKPTPLYEILSLHLSDSIAELNSISGKEQQEELLNQVFSSFCVGK